MWGSAVTMPPDPPKAWKRTISVLAFPSHQPRSIILPSQKVSFSDLSFKTLEGLSVLRSHSPLTVLFLVPVPAVTQQRVYLAFVPIPGTKTQTPLEFPEQCLLHSLWAHFRHP
jgi:hypothetical protein